MHTKLSPQNERLYKALIEKLETQLPPHLQEEKLKVQALIRATTKGFNKLGFK